ncbi:MAG: transketolase C-terminal domain-containing protein, partial [Candidatus Eisenbacteria bacterium]
LTYLSCIPNLVVAAPSSGAELRDLLRTAIDYDRGPFAIRYPRAAVPDADALGHPARPVEIGRWVSLRPGTDGHLLAVGPMVAAAWDASDLLAAAGLSFGVVNARFVKPLDVEMLRALAGEPGLLVTIEENVLSGGFGSRVGAALGECAGSRAPECRLLHLGLPDQFVEHGSRDGLLESVGLTPAGIAGRIREALSELKRFPPDLRLADEPGAKLPAVRWSAS